MADPYSFPYRISDDFHQGKRGRTVGRLRRYTLRGPGRIIPVSGSLALDVHGRLNPAFLSSSGCVEPSMVRERCMSDPQGAINYTERMVPEEAHARIFWEHVGRYRFAKDFVLAPGVLDIACGDGYGAAALARAGARA